MTNLMIAMSATLTVAAFFVPLIGAQRKSMVYHEEFVKQAFVTKNSTDDNEAHRKVDMMISLSRSWTLSFALLFLGPFATLKNALKPIKQSNTQASKNDEELNKMFVGSLFFSNPITMTIALILCVIGFAIGSFILFSVISLMAITANDNQKLANTNFVTPTRYVISENINQAYQIMSKHMKQKS
jgi:hypothetical protein